MNDFMSKIAEILEVDDVNPDFQFRTIPDWDSMKGFSIIVLLEQDYGKQMSVEEFMTCETVLELAKFAEVS